MFPSQFGTYSFSFLETISLNLVREVTVRYLSPDHNLVPIIQTLKLKKFKRRAVNVSTTINIEITLPFSPALVHINGAYLYQRNRKYTYNQYLPQPQGIKEREAEARCEMRGHKFTTTTAIKQTSIELKKK